MPYTTAPMLSLVHKSLVTKPHGLTYSYYLSPDFSSQTSSTPTTAPTPPATPTTTLLFLHGFPDDAHMWAGAVPQFLALPYRFVLLDLLGFGGSSKPGRDDAGLYNYRKQADAIAQVLDLEGVEGGVVPIGHDWGSATAQRFYLYQRARCTGLCLLSLAFQIPSPQPFDLDEQNRVTTQRFGYPQWEYWNFFTAPDAPALMRAHLDRFFEVNHGVLIGGKGDEGEGRDVWMREMFCVPGAMRAYVTQTGAWEGRTVELKAYAKADASIFERFRDRMARDGLEGPVCYYHSLKGNTMLEDEKALCEGKAGAKIEVPVLYIGQTGDWVCRTDLMGDAKEKGLLSDVEEKVVEAGHWVLYEKPEEVAGLISEWLLRKFPVKQ